jgi:hypothetical protein
MKRLIIIPLCILNLSACTGHRIKPAAVCDGKHRRPANLYGTILPSLPIPLPASQGGGQSTVAPPRRESRPALTPTPSAPVTSPGTKSGAGGSDEPSPAQADDPPRLSQRDLALSLANC